MENPKFTQKLKILSKSTNVGFCGNFFNKSLVLMLKYTACKFYDCTTVFEEMRKLWIWKKNHFFFSLKKNEQSYEKNKIKYKQSYEIKEKMNNLTK